MLCLVRGLCCLAMLVGAGCGRIAFDPSEVKRVDLVAGGYQSCAIEGSHLFCWGEGPLGDGSTEASAAPLLIPAVTDPVMIDAHTHRCAIDRRGALSCWGRNPHGEVGDGTVVERDVPVAIDIGGPASEVTGGFEHTCALHADGRVACWGNNDNGQLGDGTTTSRTVAAPVVELRDASAITAGDRHTCVLGESGEIACWGGNLLGQLGDGTAMDRSTPVRITGSYRAVAAGDDHTCAVDREGFVACWGSNSNGQLGDGTTISRGVPVQVAGLDRVTAICAGAFHTCALRLDGTVACWGSNVAGELGDGTLTDRTSPVDVVDLPPIAELRCRAGGHSCARTDARTVFCWGENSLGQLGDGTRTNRARPVQIGPFGA